MRGFGVRFQRSAWVLVPRMRARDMQLGVFFLASCYAGVIHCSMQSYQGADV